MASSSSSSTSYQYDLSTGQDRAHAIGGELSGMRAKGAADLYQGNVPDLLASTARIRDMQKYLRAAGRDPNEIEVIPDVRLASVTQSSSNSRSTSEKE